MESREAAQMTRLPGNRATETVYIWDLRPTESLSNSFYSMLRIQSLFYPHDFITQIGSRYLMPNTVNQ